MGKRILLVGGVDGHLRLDTYLHLMGQNHKVAVAAPNPLPSVTAEGCEVFQYALARHSTVLNDLAALRDLRRITKTWHPDIVHAFDTKPNYLVPLALRGMKGVHVIRTINGLGRIFSTDSVKYKLLRHIFFMLHRIARPFVTRTIFQNSADMKLFVDNKLISNKDAVLIPGSGIHTERIRLQLDPLRRDQTRSDLGWSNKIVFILISRLLKEKGIYEYFQAARRLSQSTPQVECVLVGPSAETEYGAVSKKMLQENSDVITYLGERQDVPALLNAADIFVLPTKYREGIPRSLLEAMAMGKPVIVSDMPGCGEVVKKAGCGLVVRPGDGPGLAEAMEAMAKRTDLAALSRSGSASVDAFYTHKKIMADLDMLYAELD